MLYMLVLESDTLYTVSRIRRSVHCSRIRHCTLVLDSDALYMLVLESDTLYTVSRIRHSVHCSGFRRSTLVLDSDTLYTVSRIRHCTLVLDSDALGCCSCCLLCVFVFQGHEWLCGVVFKGPVLHSNSSSQAAQCQSGHAQSLTGRNRTPAAPQAQVLPHSHH